MYSCPDQPPPVLVSAFGPKAADVAARIGDGFVSTKPDKELLDRYRGHGGTGPSTAGVKICWGPDREEAAKLAHRLWRSSGVPGELSQDLRSPALFEQAAQLVTVDAIADKLPCGPDPGPIVEAVKEYVDAGFDRVYVNQIGPDQEQFFKFFTAELAPALADIDVVARRSDA
ncbi:MAG: LLM class flavin-dependent oxidoreductase [Acidimicrobiales bacterium]